MQKIPGCQAVGDQFWLHIVQKNFNKFPKVLAILPNFRYAKYSIKNRPIFRKYRQKGETI